MLQKKIKDSEQIRDNLLTNVEMNRIRFVGYDEINDDKENRSQVDNGNVENQEIILENLDADDNHNAQDQISISDEEIDAAFNSLTTSVDEFNKEISTESESEIRNKETNTVSIEPEKRGGRPRRITESTESLIKEIGGIKEQKYRPIHNGPYILMP